MGAEAGIIRTRSGDVYKPSALRNYRSSLKVNVLPELGRLRLSALDGVVIQDVIDRLVAQGDAPSTVRNAILPLRAIVRRALVRGEIAQNPTLLLALPADRARRERVARPHEARALIEAVPARDSAVWATAFYAGLRRGEMQALRWKDVDFEGGVVRVERSWDRQVGPIEPKSRSGRRRVPLAPPLRGRLAAYGFAHPPEEESLVFGASGGRAFRPDGLTSRARAAWKRAGLVPIGLHECRHTYAAFMIAAGVNVKALATYMGHSSIKITLDRYGHLMPGNEEEAAQMLGNYLERESDS